MYRGNSRILLMLAGAIALAVIPTMGSRGMGTLGERFVHPDHGLFEQGPEAASRAKPLLKAADAAVTVQVSAIVAR